MDFSTEDSTIFNIILTFCRVSPIISFLPGGSYIPAFVRIIISIIFSTLISEVASTHFAVANYMLTSIAEILIGIFIALVVHLVFMAVNTAGGIINSLSGISIASVLDSTIHTSNPVIGKFFSTIFITLFFISNMHIMLIIWIIKSYDVLNYNTLFANSSDFVEYISTTISKIFELSLNMAAPILVISVLLYVSVGIINKMIPYVQVFFIFVPIHMWISFFVIFLYLNNIFVWFSSEFSSTISELLIVENS